MTASIGVLKEAFESVSRNGYDNSAPLTFSPQFIVLEKQYPHFKWEKLQNYF